MIDSSSDAFIDTVQEKMAALLRAGSPDPAAAIALLTCANIALGQSQQKLAASRAMVFRLEDEIRMMVRQWRKEEYPYEEENLG